MAKQCPNGDGDFDDWVVRCPKCGERLIDPPAPDHHDVPQQIAVAPNEAIAGMWVSALNGEGIVAFARPLGPGFGAWGSVATFEHEVIVRHSDIEQAKLVLAEFMDIEGDETIQ
jgi:hypothetical protein